MLKLGESSIEKVTPTKALAWLDSVEHQEQERLQRPIRQSWVNSLAREMHKGRFMPVNTIHFAFHDEKAFLVNGQHTLWAISKSQIAQSLNVIRTQAKDMDEVKSLYYRYDHGLKRNLADSLRALSLDDVTGLSNGNLKKVASSARFIHSRFLKTLGKRHYSDDEDIGAITIWASHLKPVLKCKSGGNGIVSQRILNRSVLSIALITFRFQADKAAEFWFQVSHDDGISATDPRKKLHKYLFETGVSGGKSRQRMNISTVKDMAIATSVCWNAFYEHDQISRLQTKGREVDLLGCDLETVYEELDEIYEG